MTPELKEQIDSYAYSAARNQFHPQHSQQAFTACQICYRQGATVWAERAEKLREALERIANPIAALQKQASADGRYMDAAVAQSLADNAPYLRLQAQEALEEYKKQTQ